MKVNDILKLKDGYFKVLTILDSSDTFYQVKILNVYFTKVAKRVSIKKELIKVLSNTDYVNLTEIIKENTEYDFSKLIEKLMSDSSIERENANLMITRFITHRHKK